MTVLQPIIDNEYQPSMAGTIAHLASVLLEELEFSGESIAIEDAEKSIIDHAVLYAGWQSLYVQKNSTQPIEVNQALELELGEWSIIEPVVRAHLELIHSKRVDGSGAISGERTGKDPMTANTDYVAAKEEMKKNAFCEEVFSV